MAPPPAFAKVFDGVTTSISKALPALFRAATGILISVWFFAYVLHIPGLYGLSPSQLIGRATQLVGYPHPHWLTAASAWLQQPRRSHTVSAFVPLVAGLLACLASIEKHGPRLALAAWTLILVGVEAAGTQVAVHTALVVAVIFAATGTCDALRYAVKRTTTWSYVAGDTLLQHFYVVVAWPAVLLFVPFQLLLDTWLDPPWLGPTN